MTDDTQRGAYSIKNPQVQSVERTHIVEGMVLYHSEFKPHLEDDENIVAMCLHKNMIVIGTTKNRVMFFNVETKEPCNDAGEKP